MNLQIKIVLLLLGNICVYGSKRFIRSYAYHSIPHYARNGLPSVKLTRSPYLPHFFGSRAVCNNPVHYHPYPMYQFIEDGHLGHGQIDHVDIDHGYHSHESFTYSIPEGWEYSKPVSAESTPQMLIRPEKTAFLPPMKPLDYFSLPEGENFSNIRSNNFPKMEYGMPDAPELHSLLMPSRPPMILAGLEPPTYFNRPEILKEPLNDIVIPEAPTLPPLSMSDIPTFESVGDDLPKKQIEMIPEKLHISDLYFPQAPEIEAIPPIETPEFQFEPVNHSEIFGDDNPKNMVSIDIPEAPMLPPLSMPDFSAMEPPALPPLSMSDISTLDSVGNDSHKEQIEIIPEAPHVSDLYFPQAPAIEALPPPETPEFQFEPVNHSEIFGDNNPENIGNIAIPEAPMLPPLSMPDFSAMELQRETEFTKPEEPVIDPEQNEDNNMYLNIPEAPILPDITLPEFPGDAAIKELETEFSKSNEEPTSKVYLNIPNAPTLPSLIIPEIFSEKTSEESKFEIPKPFFELPSPPQPIKLIEHENIPEAPMLPSMVSPLEFYQFNYSSGKDDDEEQDYQEENRHRESHATAEEKMLIPPAPELPPWSNKISYPLFHKSELPQLGQLHVSREHTIDDAAHFKYQVLGQAGNSLLENCIYTLMNKRVLPMIYKK